MPQPHSRMNVIHPFDPIADEDSRVLILGSFPSVQSVKTGFYYGHPQNRFWKVLSAIFDDPLPQTNAEKKAFLKAHHLALWDVLASCEIIGSSDASIKNPVPNDLSALIQNSKITTILINGKSAMTIFTRFIQVKDILVITLPSTSAANAAVSLEELIRFWSDALRPWLD